MSDTRAFIYALCDPDTGEVRYVGKTKDPYHRFYSHIAPYPKQRERNTHKYRWLRQLREQGKQPLLSIIEEVGEQEWQERERYWIDYYRTLLGARLTNIAPGGEGGISPESAAKVSATLRGHTLSPETRERISQKLQGRKLSPEHAEKTAAMIRRLVHTSTWADRISATKRATYRALWDGRETFTCGHPYTPENTYTYTHTDKRHTGRTRVCQQCQQCRRERNRKRRQANRENTNAQGLEQ